MVKPTTFPGRAESDVDLFGEPVEVSRQSSEQAPSVNDMDLIQTVLTTAIHQGYALVGPRKRVFRLLDRGEIDTVDTAVEQAVCQLLDAAWLTVGGTHRYTYRHRTRSGNAVLVPQTSKAALRRWRSLKRPATWPNAPRSHRSPRYAGGGGW